MHNVLPKSLTLIFQTIINKGQFATAWKLSEITPNFIDGDRKNISCYRPIRLLCNSSKILEKLIFDEFHLFLETQMSDAHYRFLQVRSAIMQLLVYLDKFHRSLNLPTTLELAAIYIDFKKFSIKFWR